jgi:hypothetical protein
VVGKANENLVLKTTSDRPGLVSQTSSTHFTLVVNVLTVHRLEEKVVV